MIKSSFIASIFFVFASLNAYARTDIPEELTKLYNDLQENQLLIRNQVARIIEEVEPEQQVKEYNYFVESALKKMKRMRISRD